MDRLPPSVVFVDVRRTLLEAGALFGDDGTVRIAAEDWSRLLLRLADGQDRLRFLPNVVRDGDGKPDMLARGRYLWGDVRFEVV